MSNYVSYIGSAKQFSDHLAVMSYLINHVSRTYDNGDNNRDMQSKQGRTPIDFDEVRPSMGNTTTVVNPKASNPAKIIGQQKLDKETCEVEMMYEAEIKSFVDRES